MIRIYLDSIQLNLYSKAEERTDDLYSIYSSVAMRLPPIRAVGVFLLTASAVVDNAIATATAETKTTTTQCPGTSHI
jgi:hypothetical protein